MSICRWFLCFMVMVGCASTNQSTIDTLMLDSKIYNNKRVIRVYLPSGYDGKTPFKVFYLNDGQNLFGDTEKGAAHEWRVDEIMDSLASHAQVEPMVVVGIDHAGKDRGNEYLPWPDEFLSPPLSNPQGSLYPDFLTTEVMPVIEEKYRVLKGKEHTGIGGASYGGLIALYTVLSKPETFGYTLIESPSLYVHDHQILTMVNEQPGTWPLNIYLGIGTNEMGLPHCGTDNTDNSMAVNDVDSLQLLIRQQSPESRIMVKIDSCAMHGEKAWTQRLPAALKFLMKLQ